MKRTALLAAAMATGLFTASHALAAEEPADTSAMPAPVEGVDTNAPLEGENSFTEAQVIERLEDHGFTAITGLALDDKGVWRGEATFDNVVGPVAVDYRGNVVYGADNKLLPPKE